VKHAALGLSLALLAATPAAADERLALSADARETGYVRLQLHAQPGMAVTIDEGGQQVAQLVPGATEVTLRRATEWRCDRQLRRFTATAADGESATAEVRTPSCARRLRLAAPSRVRSGAAVPVRLLDRWRLGDVAISFCVEPPGGPARCRQASIAEGVAATRERFAALRPGGWRISAETPYQRLLRRVRADHPGGRLTLLATGDSMVQIIDSYLKQRLGPRGVRVRSDARISTGISKPSLLDWQTHARRQAAGIHPDVTVMFLGANDGFPMAGQDCCGPDWIDEYARRARRMMSAYGRGGRGRVYWLLLPAPRGGFFREVFPAVNAALRKAAAGARRDVRLIELDKVFTPGGRYRDTMRIGHRNVRVRQSDGVHLSTAGASLAASILIHTLRAERILR
jgi:lysophospholipase L1-like esterase